MNRTNANYNSQPSYPGLSEPRRRRWGLIIWAAALAAAIQGCAHDLAASPRAQDSFVRITETAGPRFTANSLASLHVENPHGDVVLRVQPELSDAVVEAKDRTNSGSFSPENPVVEIEIQKQFAGDRMRLMVVPRMLTDQDRAIDLLIRMPSCGGATITNAGGEVDLRGLTGSVRVQSGTDQRSGGPITINTHLALAGPIELTTTSGDISVRTGPGTAGRFSLNADRGRVVADIRGTPVTAAAPTSAQWNARVGNAEHEVVMRTLNGNVEVHIGR